MLSISNDCDSSPIPRVHQEAVTDDELAQCTSIIQYSDGSVRIGLLLETYVPNLHFRQIDICAFRKLQPFHLL
jgi:hypothetical protein